MYKACELWAVSPEIINEGKENEIFGCAYRHPSITIDEFNEFPLMVLQISSLTRTKFLIFVETFTSIFCKLKLHSLTSK